MRLCNLLSASPEPSHACLVIVQPRTTKGGAACRCCTCSLLYDRELYSDTPSFNSFNCLLRRRKRGDHALFGSLTVTKEGDHGATPTLAALPRSGDRGDFHPFPAHLGPPSAIPFTVPSFDHRPLLLPIGPCRVWMQLPVCKCSPCLGSASCVHANAVHLGANA